MGSLSVAVIIFHINCVNKAAQISRTGHVQLCEQVLHLFRAANTMNTRNATHKGPFSPTRKENEVNSMEQKKTADLFNDSLGPVMCGPSSSHTGGPARIGRLAHDLCGGSFQKVVIQFCKNTSYAKDCRSMGSDKGLYGGLMGWAPDHKDLYDAVDIASQKGRDITIEVIEEQASHSNAIWFDCVTLEGFHLTAKMTSIGGASIEITEIDGLKVLLLGGRYELVVWGDEHARKRAEQYAGRASDFFDERLSVLSLGAPVDIAEIRRMEGVEYAALLRPVLPCVTTDEQTVLFSSAAGLLDWLEENPMDLASAAFAYQQAVSGWDRARIYAHAKTLLHAMLDSIDSGLKGDERGFFCLRPVSSKMKALMDDKKLIPMGVIERASVYAQAVIEANMAMHRLVAAPTGGSAGVIPGAVLSCAQEGGSSEEKTIDSLMVAALIGSFIFTNATFSGFYGGCSAEIGSAAGMSAAAVAYLYGADTKTCLKAAGLAIQNLIGLACDTLPSGVEVPCIHRNAMGSAVAILSANMAMSGVDPYLPLDESIQASYRYSTCRSPFEEDSRGAGISISPTARRVSEEMQNARANAY